MLDLTQPDIAGLTELQARAVIELAGHLDWMSDHGLTPAQRAEVFHRVALLALVDDDRGNLVRFQVQGNPLPKGRPRVVHTPAGPHAYTPNATRTWEQAVALAAKDATPSHRLSGPLVVELRFYRDNRRHADLDNLAKSVLDGAQSIAFADDKQVVQAHLYRDIDRDRPRVEATIVEVAE